MSYPTSQQGIFRAEDVDQAIERADSLFSALPPDAVRKVAQEALGRLAARNATAQQGKPATPPLPAEIDALCRALTSADPGAATRIVQAALAAGAMVEDVCLQHLAPAARRLGQLWDEDRLSFLEVTMATARILAILRILDGHRPAPIVQTARSAVFAAVPGETHTLGVRMATDLFRRRGWDVTLETGRSHDELVERITTLRSPLIGLSAAGAHAVPALARLIVALRTSLPAPLIAIGGQIVQEARETIEAMQADGVITGDEDAERVLGLLWDERIARSGRPAPRGA